MDDIWENDPSDMALDFGECLAADAVELLRLAVEKRLLSARGFYKLIRVAWSIANLGQSKQVGREEVAGALAYRMMPLLASAPRFLSMASQVRLAIFIPERESISRMPVGDVTLISVR